ncbi:MAG: hypothetical protein IJJ44_00450 [Solobacterium sp.]|nr:hypothetical protein [Solobacterium sp.]
MKEAGILNLSRNNDRIQKNTGLIILFINTLVLLFHAQYGFCQTDEPFYAALVHRLYLGEAPVVNEWHLTQLYAPVFLPFYALFRGLTGSADYTILYFRVLRILLAFGASVFLYHNVCRNYGVIPGIIAGLLVQVYSRANINGCSYYTVFYIFVSAAGVLTSLCMNEDTHPAKRKIYAFLCGIMYSLSVLCNPYFALPVVIMWMILVLRGNRSVRESCLYVLAGILASAFVYLVFLLSRASVAEMLKSLPYILMNDDDHMIKVIDIVYLAVLQALEYMDLLSLAAVAGTFVIAFIYRKKEFPLPARVVYLLLSIAAMIKSLSKIKYGVCFVSLLPVTLIGFPLFLRKLHLHQFDLGFVFYLIGGFSAVVFMLASVTVIDAMTIGFALCTISTICMLSEVIQGVSTRGIGDQLLYLCLCILILVPCYCHRIFGTYRDTTLAKMNTRIEQGPARGLYTSPKHAREHDHIYEAVMTQYRKDPDAQVMFSKELPWAYLCTDWGYGSPSAWGNEVANPVLKDYYELFPDKVPDYVYIFETEVAGYDTVTFNSHTARHQYEMQDMEGWFYDTYIVPAEILYKDEYVTVYLIDHQ